MGEYVLDRPLGLYNLKDNIMMSQFKNSDEFPFSGIWLFTGSQGSGKTLLLMHTLRDIVRDFPECLIVSNISIFGVPALPYQGIEDFEKYNNGQRGIVYVLDEIQTMYNSLESAKMPPSTLSVWSQNRKNRRVILGTSQRFNRVAKGLREQCTYNVECRKSFFHFYPYRVIDASYYDDNGKLDIDKDEIPGYHYYIPEKKVMLMYNTLEVVRGDKK